MLSSYSKIFNTVLFTIIFSAAIYAQPTKGEFVNASIGLGFSYSNDGSNYSSSGFNFHAEYVFCNSKWIGFRPYLGVISTSNTVDENYKDSSQYIVTTQALLIGGKARFCAPIPYITPYLDLGLGASIGTFRTLTPNSDKKKSGIIPHIPLSLGLMLGRKHNFDISFTYYLQNSINQFAIVAAFGISFPVE